MEQSTTSINLHNKQSTMTDHTCVTQKGCNHNFKRTTLKKGPLEFTYLALLWKPLDGPYVQVNEHDEHI